MWSPAEGGIPGFLGMVRELAAADEAGGRRAWRGGLLSLNAD